MSTSGATDAPGTQSGPDTAGWTGQSQHPLAASQFAPVEQARRGWTSVNSGWGERIADIGLGGTLVALGLRRGSWPGAVMIASGGMFLYAAATGHFPPYAALALVRERQSSGAGLVVEQAVTIQAPRQQVYAYVRDFTHLPAFANNLRSVTATDGHRSHWIAEAPLGRQVEWDAQITAERPDELIVWESLPGAQVPNHGEVRFADAPGGRGTELIVRLAYQPPLGTAGAALARVFTKEPNQQVGEDFRRLKAILEAGEAPTTKGQPHGRLAIGSGKGLQLARSAR